VTTNRPKPPETTAWWKRVTPYGAAIVHTLLFYSPRFLPQTAFALADSLDQNVQNRVFLAQALSAGRLPHWTEAVYGGYPFLSDPQAAVWYPVHLVLGLLGVTCGSSAQFDTLVLAHVLMLALGTVFLARTLGLGALGAVAASVAFTHNGYMVNHLSHTVIINGIAVGTWATGCLVLAVRRQSLRWAAAAGLLFACVVLTGHWQTGLYVWYTAAFGTAAIALREWVRDRNGWHLLRSTGLIALAFVLGLAGSAIQAAPTLALLATSERRALLFKDATIYTGKVWQLPGLVLPNLYRPLWWRVEPDRRWDVSGLCWGADGYHENVFWIGLAGMTLALIGALIRQRRLAALFLATVAVFVTIASWGQTGGLYPLLYEYLPGMKQVRIPPRLMFVAMLAVSLLSGIAVDALADRPHRRACLFVGLALVVGWMAFGSWLAIQRSAAPDWTTGFVNAFAATPSSVMRCGRSPDLFRGDIVAQLCLGGAVTVLLLGWLAAAASRRVAHRGLAAAAIVLLFGELWLYGYGRNVWVGNPGFANSAGDTGQAMHGHAHGRVLRTNHGIWGRNAGLTTGMRYAGGYNPLAMERVARLLPPEEPVRGLRTRENHFDIWWITHLLCPAREVTISLDDREVQGPDAGTISLAASHSNLPASLEWVAPADTEVRRVHLVASASCAAGFSDDFLVGGLHAIGSSGDIVASTPLSLGRNIAEWKYDSIAPLQPAHRRPRPAFVRPFDGITSQTNYYLASLDVPNAIPLRAVRVECFVTAPVQLEVTHLVFETTAGPAVRTALEGLGYRRVASGHPAWFVFRRPDPPGEVWVVPTAEAYSYKKQLEYFLPRYHDPALNPRTTVLLSKQQVPRESLPNLNAPRPEDFTGTATLTRMRPEHAVLTAEASQRGWLVISQTWHEGWRADMNGRPVPIIQANGAHSAIAVPAGRHEITLRYYTPRFAVGATVSAVAWLAALGVILWPRPRRSA
jgi:hypothetical protein